MRYPFIPRVLIPSFLGLSLAIAGNAHGQQGSVYIHIDSQPPYTSTFDQACMKDITAGFHTAQVVVAYSYPFRSIRFTAVVPPGAIFVGEHLLIGGSFTGNSQTGIEIDLAGCGQGINTAVLELGFIAQSAIDDYTWVVGPAAGKPTIEFEDCDGFPMTGTGQFSIYCDKSYMLGPYKPSPPDGATDVPLDALLSFVGAATEVGVADHPIQGAYEGNVFYCESYPYPPDSPPCDLPLDPGPLLPNTTYYWRAFNVCCCCEHGDYGAGDVWSFTTGDEPLATEETTWGRVKAMYRE